MKLYTKLLCTTGAMLLFSTTSLLSADKSAISVMKNAYAYTGGMDTYAFDALIVENDASIKYKHTVHAKIDRPNNLRVDVKGDFRDRTNYIHNGTYTMVDHDFGYYGEMKSGKGIDGTLEYILKSFGINAPLTALLFSDMGKRMKFKKGTYFGTKEVAGVECDYVAFKNNKKEVHVWVARGDKPLVQAYSIIDIETKEHKRMNVTLAWHTDAKINESDFVFKAPKGVMKISVVSAN